MVEDLDGIDGAAPVSYTHLFFILLVGFFLIGQSYGLLLALGLAMLDFIPIVGAGTIMVPWAFLALFTHDYAQAIQIMLIWGVIAMFRRVGEPKVVGDQTRCV